MKEAFDYGDLEAVAKAVYDRMRAEAEEVDSQPLPRWNRSQIVTEAVNGVAFKP